MEYLHSNLSSLAACSSAREVLPANWCEKRANLALQVEHRRAFKCTARLLRNSANVIANARKPTELAQFTAWHKKMATDTAVPYSERVMHDKTWRELLTMETRIAASLARLYE